MDRLIAGYDWMKAPSTFVPKSGHTQRISIVKVLSRITKGFFNAMDLLARDIRELRRVYPDVPNLKLKELMQLNKDMYPKAFKKCR